MTHALPKLHNAMWPGLVGKGDGEGQEPPISLERMLELTAAANVGGQKFDGIDYFLFLPHTDPNASDEELKRIADFTGRDPTVPRDAYVLRVAATVGRLGYLATPVGTPQNSANAPVAQLTPPLVGLGRED